MHRPAATARAAVASIGVTDLLTGQGLCHVRHVFTATGRRPAAEPGLPLEP